ncbi:hypothetical protein K474DRAFT_1676861 [Panus rudis PR-1116 ss-1]|nr:hypothetical protein K474DRAFT_1676861 [Panus rudis PR-1116 ss-1]
MAIDHDLSTRVQHRKEGSHSRICKPWWPLPCPWPDRTRYHITRDGNTGAREIVDEIEEYWSGQYLSSTEAGWRILGFNICLKEPAVTALSVHLPLLSESSHYRQYSRGRASEPNTGPLPSLSLLERYFLRPLGSFSFPDGSLRIFRDLTYMEYFATFRLAKYDPSKVGNPLYHMEQSAMNGAQLMHVILRDTKKIHVTRLHPSRPSEGECFYLRILLQHRPASSFEDLRTIDGVVFPSFQEAAIALHQENGKLVQHQRLEPKKKLIFSEIVFPH